MNKKGQALVEFVIILPVFLLVVFAIIDFGIILYTKNNLENIIGDSIELYKEGKTNIEIEENINKNISKAKFKILNNNDGTTKIIIYKEKELITPGLKVILDNPYKIEVSRVILNE